MLKIFGKLFFMGEKPGLGQTMKLANNLLAAASMAITSEGVAMGLKAGLDPKAMMDVLNVSSGTQQRHIGKVAARGAAAHLRCRLRHRAVASRT